MVAASECNAIGEYIQSVLRRKPVICPYRAGENHPLTGWSQVQSLQVPPNISRDYIVKRYKPFFLLRHNCDKNIFYCRFFFLFPLYPFLLNNFRHNKQKCTLLSFFIFFAQGTTQILELAREGFPQKVFAIYGTKSTEKRNSLFFIISSYFMASLAFKKNLFFVFFEGNYAR